MRGIAVSMQYQITVLDLTKTGKMTPDTLDTYMMWVQAQSPTNGRFYVLMTLCPTLASDRAVNGVEGERRRLFDKLAAKGYTSHMVTISCKTDNTHGNARRRQNFKAFMSMKENTCPPDGQNVVTFLRNDSSSNVFLASDMFCTEGNTGRPNLLPQHLWCDPRTELCDKCPRSHDAPQHWTPQQQSAQQTSSYEVVADIIESLSAGTQIKKNKINSP